MSFSQLQLYRICPRQYEFACIKKLPRSISAGESFGSSVHNTLKKFGEEEMAMAVGDKRLAVGNQLQLFAEKDSYRPPPTAHRLIDLWHQSFIVEGYESKADADSARKKGETIMQKFFDWWAGKHREVIAVEKGFSIEVESDKRGVRSVIRGRFDRVEKTDGGIVIIDYKTSKPRSQEDIDNDLQLSIYALACEETFGEPCAGLTLLFLREDGITEMHTSRSAKQKEAAMRNITTLSGKIESRDFAPTPSVSVCKHCPYRSVCDASAV